jgi:hypothetical protein
MAKAAMAANSRFIERLPPELSAIGFQLSAKTKAGGGGQPGVRR